ncbi:diacylglycerol kinase family protein [Actinomycetaceae bacterium L2_0104]
MRPLLLVVNPAANGGRTATLESPVRRALAENGWDVTVQRTESIDHATDILRECESGQTVAVLAGDGVLARALAGAYESGAVVAPLSGGRGNDLVRTLGIPVDPLVAARRLGPFTSETRIDVGRCNGRFFVGVACIGIGTYANQVANQTPWLRGTAVYILGVIRALLRYRPALFHIRIDGRHGSLRSWNVAIGNSQSIGGGMRICPGASLTDGILEMTAIQGRPIPVVVPALLRIFNGSHVKMRGVFQKEAHRIQVSSDSALPIYADGEHLADLPAVFTVEPEAVSVLV